MKMARNISILYSKKVMDEMIRERSVFISITQLLFSNSLSTLIFVLHWINNTSLLLDFYLNQKLFNLLIIFIIMRKRCAICNKAISEEFGKLRGTMLKVLGLNKKAEFIFVCSSCQNQDKWDERAKIKGA